LPVIVRDFAREIAIGSEGSEGGRWETGISSALDVVGAVLIVLTPLMVPRGQRALAPPPSSESRKDTDPACWLR